MSEEVFQPAEHLIQMVDTHRSQWKWRCVRCKQEHLSAIQMMELPCLATTGLIDAADDMLAALLESVCAFSLEHDANRLPYYAEKAWRDSAAAIRKAKGES